MAESKKYYWLKLKRDFFKRHDVRIIEQMPNGKDYLLFYLKMLLESVDHEGHLRFSETIPYNEQMLSIVTDTNIDIVKAAMSLFAELGMVEILDDNTIYMNEVKRMIGSAADNDNAKRQKRFRERKKQAELENVTGCVTKNNESKRIDKEIKKEKDLDKEINKEIEENKESDCEQVAALYNSLCPSLPTLKIISNSIKNDLETSIAKYSLEEFETLFKKAEASKFLKGENARKWLATFDWLIKAENIAKVLNGNFDGKKEDNPYADIEAILFRQMQENETEEEPVTIENNEELKARAEALKQQLNGK